MNHADPATIKNINEAALKEFISNGYKNASLRSIAREAGVTTGAFYGYYKSKAEVFDGIVGEHAKFLKALFAVRDGEDYSDFGKSRFTRLLYTHSITSTACACSWREVKERFIPSCSTS